MHQSTQTPRGFRFGVFEADLRTGEVSKGGRKVKLQEQPFQVLAMLLERAGEVVTREDIQRKLWTADTFVDFEHGLNIAINKIREALGDSAENSRFVETLPKRGYRFIAPVEALDSPKPEAIAPAGVRPVESAKEEPVRLRRAGWRYAIASLGGVAAVAGLLVALNAGGLRDRLRGIPPLPQIQSIAVLPLENLSGDPEQEYFADGMTDALITELGQSSTLRVTSRTSIIRYKEAKKPLPEIARELNVDAIVEGGVLRSGDRVRITAQLIYAPTDRHLWAETYEEDLRNVMQVQRQVAQAIAREIRANLASREQA
ncbi:MAG: winged helix-turn-helix domain-containing protein, partial [Terriglobia bacterium]